MSLLKNINVRKLAFIIAAVVGGIALTAGVVTAATTISTDISTGGMLSVTGTSTLAGGFSAGGANGLNILNPGSTNAQLLFGTTTPVISAGNNASYQEVFDETNSIGYAVAFTGNGGPVPDTAAMPLITRRAYTFAN